MGEHEPVFRSGDRVRVICGPVTLSGRVLAVRPDGRLLCLMDGSDGTLSVDPSLCRIEVQRPKKPDAELF